MGILLPNRTDTSPIRWDSIETGFGATTYCMDIPSGGNWLLRGPWGRLLVCWLAATLSAQAQIDTLFGYPADQRLLKLWQSAPFVAITHPPFLKERDSSAVFAQLDRLRNVAQQQDDDRLFWTVQLHKILFRHTLLDVREKKSTVLENAQAYMDGCPVRVVQASYWYHRGLFDFGKQRFDTAFRWLLRAQQTFEQIGYRNIPEISEYLTGLGGRYYFFGEYATCIRYMKASLAIRI